MIGDLAEAGLRLMLLGSVAAVIGVVVVSVQVFDKVTGTSSKNEGR